MSHAVRSALALAAVLAAATLGAAPAVASPDVLPAPQLFGSVPWTDHTSDSAKLATDGTGNTFAAYDETTDVARISLVERPVGQLAYGPPTTVATLETGYRLPFGEQIASDDAGDITIAWIDERSSDSSERLWVATRFAGETTFEAPVRLSPGTPTFDGFQLADSAGGQTVLAWSSSTSPYGVYIAARSYHSDFETPLPIVADTVGDDADPTLTVGYDGTIGITWFHVSDDAQDPEHSGVVSSWVARLPAASDAFDVKTQLASSGPNGSGTRPGLALPSISPDETLTVAYESDGTGAAPADIETRVAPPHGGLSGDAPLVGTAEFQQEPKSLEAVQADRDGNATVLWVGTDVSAGVATKRLHFTSTPGALGFFGTGIDSSIPVAHAGLVGDVETSADALGGVHAAWTETSWSGSGLATTVHYAVRPSAGRNITANWPVVPAASTTVTEFAPGAAGSDTLLSVSGDPFGDASVAWGRNSAVVDHAGPIATAIQGSSYANYGTPASYSVSGTDTYSAPVAIHWTFGDGGSADGPTVSHTFAKPANVVSVPQPQTLVSATLTDAAGNTTTRTLRVTLSVFHVATPKPTPTPAAPPTLTLKLSRAHLAVAPAKAEIDHAKVSGKAGAVLTATASKAGPVSFQLAQYVPGHHVGSTCKVGAPHGHDQSACKALHAFKVVPDVHVLSGTNTLRLTGRWGGKPLKPGLYQLSGYLGSGGVSSAAQVNFRITR